MKITKEQLKQIIKEELANIFNEEAPSGPLGAEIKQLDTILVGSERAPGLFGLLDSGVDADFTSALRHLEEFAYKISDKNILNQVNELRRQLINDKKELASMGTPGREDRMLAISTFGRQKWRNIKTSIQGS